MSPLTKDSKLQEGQVGPKMGPQVTRSQSSMSFLRCNDHFADGLLIYLSKRSIFGVGYIWAKSVYFSQNATFKACSKETYARVPADLASNVRPRALNFGISKLQI